MKKDRVAAFTDAVLAIIMTILVLELEKPSAPTLAALWELRYSFFSYTLSFFWLGSMWGNIHNEWGTIEKINAKTLWVTLILLFFCSVIPYATDFVSRDFDSKVAQGFYGVFVMLVTFSNIWLSKVLEHGKNAALKVMNFTRGQQRRSITGRLAGIRLETEKINIAVYGEFPKTRRFRCLW